MHTTRRIAAVAAAGVLVLAYSVPAGAAGTALVRVSPGDPFAACTIGGVASSVLYPGAEVEPDLAVDRWYPGRAVGVWQQDRWNDGGAHGIGVAWTADGGRTFGETVLPVDACAPGGLPYERASDPWVSFGPDGTAYADALAFDGTTARNTVATAVSRDGGRTWQHPTVLIDDTSIQFFNDKNSITADPVRPGTAYALWDRLDGGPTGTQVLTGPTLLSVTRDGGRTWSTPRDIVPTGQFEQTIGNVIVADPRTGALYDFFDDLVYTDGSATTVASARYEVVRSFDAGRTWSARVPVAVDTSVADVDPNTGAALRTGSGLPSVAIDPATGRLYLAYEGSAFTGGRYDQVLLVTSGDRGLNWSRPVRVSAVAASPAFAPTVAVALDGTVGVSYYDLRTLQPGNTTTLPTSTWLATSAGGGQRFDRERPIAPVFDWLAAPRAGGFFLGDYEGLAAEGTGFRALFVTANSDQPDNRTDVYSGHFAASGGTPVPGTAVPGTAVPGTAVPGIAAAARPGVRAGSPRAH
ncbi:MAG TPA: sialidase family protein [Rugosimonospora sp.]|nr:sialidase family protein [Rugosimonospora sp.]